MPRISQNATPRRGAPTPKYTRVDFVSKAGKGGKPAGGTHTVRTPKPTIPTPIQRAFKRS